MQVNKNDQVDQCFVDHETEELETLTPVEVTVNLNHKFHQHLPANQLRTARRPEHMAPRTFFLERLPHTLTYPLNQSCHEAQTHPNIQKLKLKIANKHNLSLEQYFMKKKFKCIYNRLEHYRSDSKTFQGRLKGIDALIDYNWKSFKQLQEQQKCSVEVGEDSIDSDFESGNICRAYINIQQQRQFYLLIENDLNTYGYNNWFFYRLRNNKKGTRRFTIVNMIKKTSFFSQGMLLSIFSIQKHKFEGVKWYKGGDNITFGSINLTRNHHLNQNYFSLSFEYTFQYDNDEVYFALNQPYTYSRLVNFIHHITLAPKHISIEVKTIGYSVSNNIIPAIKFYKPQQKTKEIIFVLARQHPCETVGSFIAESIMHCLLQQTAITQFLLNCYDFIIIPMVNPDGVIHGMSRCNMAGLDLNRQWGEFIIKELTPETVKIKQFILNTTKTNKIKYMIDLHGHGKKLNSFFFSCKDSQEDVRLFSMVMKKLEPRFNLHDCTYGISRDKQSTIRSTINSMGIAHSYTLETSLYGWKDQNNEVKHFNEQDYHHIGRSLLNSIFVIEADTSLTMAELGVTKEGITSQMTGLIDIIGKQEEQNYDNNEILSQSDPEGDKLDVKELLGKCQNKILKKKIQEQLDKTKKKKSKKGKHNRFQEGSYSSKNMRQTCPSALNIRSKLSTPNNSMISKDFLLKDDINIKETGHKKPSFTQKWKERRKQIQKKKTQQQKQQNSNINQRLNLTRMENRSRIKTQSSTIRNLRPQVPHSTFFTKNQTSKNRTYHQKIKTEFRQIEDFSLPSEEEIKENQLRKSALEIKFKQLKQESLNVLLTDTLSILKITPNEKEKHQYSPDIKDTKNCSIKVRKEHLSTQPALSEPSKIMPVFEPNNSDKESMRYRKFKQFLNGAIAKKMQNSVGSVFYYFPIL